MGDQVIAALRRELRERKLTFKWFIGRYLPDEKYSTVMGQLCEFNPLQDSTRKAILSFLRRQGRIGQPAKAGDD